MGIKNTAAIFLAHLNPLTISHEKIIQNLLQNYKVVYVFPVRFLKNGQEINTRSFPFSFEIRKQMILDSLGYHDNIRVFGDYAFSSPYLKYFPAFASPSFKNLKKNIVVNIQERSFITYTGDRAERLLLKLFGFNPIKANRETISSSTVKSLLYRSAATAETGSMPSSSQPPSSSSKPPPLSSPSHSFPSSPSSISSPSSSSSHSNKDSGNAGDAATENGIPEPKDWTNFVSPKVIEIICKNWKTVENFSNSQDQTIRILGMKFPKDGFI
jgi:hypothetical protein